jgi:hypothetical protein
VYPVVVTGAGVGVDGAVLLLPDDPPVEVVTGARLLTLLLGEGVTTGSRLVPWGIAAWVTGVEVLFVGLELVIEDGAVDVVGAVLEGCDNCLGTGLVTATVLGVFWMCFTGVACVSTASPNNNTPTSMMASGRIVRSNATFRRVCLRFFLAISAR